mmetsp:Transcript_92648/g.163875  ORF Transcript_92648/g.163875 Transcript_92648/m.163875 type:complete len:208 (+) Transcript_92648:181-804(+)
MTKSSMSPTSPSERFPPACGHLALTAKSCPPRRNKASSRPCTMMGMPAFSFMPINALVCVARNWRVRGLVARASGGVLGDSLSHAGGFLMGFLGVTGDADLALQFSLVSGVTTLAGAEIRAGGRVRLVRSSNGSRGSKKPGSMAFNASWNLRCQGMPSGMSYALTEVGHQKQRATSSQTGTVSCAFASSIEDSSLKLGLACCDNIAA